MLALYAPLPWEAVAAARSTGDYVPVPAREATPPADAYRRAVRPIAYCPPPGAPFGSPETVPARPLAVLRRSVLGQRFADGAALCRALFRARRAFLGRRLDATEAARLVVASIANTSTLARTAAESTANRRA